MARSSDAHVRLEQPLHSPVVAMADPRKYVADRDRNLPKTSHFVVASEAALLGMVPGQLLFLPKAGS